MRAGIVAYCVGLSLLLSGCSDMAMVRDGIGINLGVADLPEASRLQEIYIGEICRQAGLRVAIQGEFLYCEEVGMRPAEWMTFVQAGMNDIDRRCDGYLAWLDNKRRWREPILKQLHTTAATAGAIMGLTGVGATPIAIVGTAFGFAQDTFVNYNTRLVTEIDHSVLQSVVLDNQNQFRIKVAGTPVDNRPAAIYLLRNYLRICMPFSIEMSINNTMTVYHRGGPEALRTEPLLTRPPTVARITAAVPLAPRDVVRQPGRNPDPPTDPGYATIFDPYIPKRHTNTYVVQLQSGLCVPDSEIGKKGSFTLTKAMIKIYKAAERKTGEKLNDDDATKIREQGGCKAGGGQNYFEKRTYDDPTNGAAAVKELIAGLRKTQAGASLPPETSLDGARTTIQAVRNTAPGNSKLMALPPALSGQVTPDLLSLLRRP
ncbi:MAG: hypothetical protein H0V72_08510 [Bradyrhizobium sp.]|nr:hypothetical protein [Bradyrhizobium sp.]MBA3727157.1 hypothetical protein [Armatimonadota bacterium]